MKSKSYQKVSNLALCIAFGSCTAFSAPGISEYRNIDGYRNNPVYPTLGTPNSLLIRIAPADYGDGYDLPRGVPSENEGDGNVEVNEQRLPSARQISNLVHDQGSANRPSFRNLNQLVFQFGQFLSHDTGLSEPDSHITTGTGTQLWGNESFPISVLSSDPDFAFPEIRFSRTIAAAAPNSGTGIREQINTITAFIDGSNIYGSTLERANQLRSFTGGRLKVSAGPDGHLLPLNTAGLENANPLFIPDNQMFLAGDVRANEQVGLIAMHTLFLREHNRLANQIARDYYPGANLANPQIDEAIYQEARAVVGAMLQKITYYEWLPTLIGYDAMPAYRGYRSFIDPSISNEFSSAAFRIGHTMLPNVFFPVSNSGTRSALPLQSAFFTPQYISGNGITGVLRGQSRARQQELDPFIVDGVRNFLFGPGFGGLDLAALNIQRGRDHGIPAYNNVRRAYGLAPRSDFNRIASTGTTANALRVGYGGVANLDLWSGGLAEEHISGTSLGETFTNIFVDQFTRLRDGDRFYFENRAIYSQEFIDQIHRTSLQDIIARNTGMSRSEVNEYPFFIRNHHPFRLDIMVGKRPQMQFMAGNNVYNYRAIRQTVAVATQKTKWANSFVTFQNDGSFSNSGRLIGNLLPQHAFTTREFLRVNGQRTNVTGAVLTGRFHAHLNMRTRGQIHSQSRLRSSFQNIQNQINAVRNYRLIRLGDPKVRDLARARLQFR